MTMKILGPLLLVLCFIASVTAYCHYNGNYYGYPFHCEDLTSFDVSSMCIGCALLVYRDNELVFNCSDFLCEYSNVTQWSTHDYRVEVAGNLNSMRELPSVWYDGSDQFSSNVMDVIGFVVIITVCLCLSCGIIVTSPVWRKPETPDSEPLLTKGETPGYGPVQTEYKLLSVV